MGLEAYFIHISRKLELIRYGVRDGKINLLDTKELKSYHLWRDCFAEFIAVLFYVFLGCMATVHIEGENSVYQIRISLSFGLAMMAMIQIVGHVSGGHVNPAVTIAMLISRNISLLRTFFYFIAQILGGIFGGLFVKIIIPSGSPGNAVVPMLSPGVSKLQGFCVEFFLTFILVLVIMATTDKNRPEFGSPGVIIGFAVALGHLAGYHYTGASMNPSRYFGGAVVFDSWENHWIYWLAPITGGVFSALLYTYILNPYRGLLKMEEAVARLEGESHV